MVYILRKNTDMLKDII